MQFKKLPPPYVSSFIPELNNMLKFLFNRKPVVDDKSITTAKLADGAVTTDKLADGVVTSGKLADGAVTTGKIADGTIAAVKLADGSVITEKLTDGAVITNKLADGAVTADKIAAGAIPDTKHNYSTTEQVVGTWIDGKPLYEKTFVLKSGVNLPTLTNGFNNVLLGDGGSAFDVLFLQSGFIFGRWTGNNNPYCYSLGGAETVDTNPMYANMIYINQLLNDNNKVTMRLYLYELAATTYIPIDQIIATIRYTKTTDTAGE